MAPRHTHTPPDLLLTQDAQRSLVVSLLHVVPHNSLVVLDELGVKQELLHAAVAGDEVEGCCPIQGALTNKPNDDSTDIRKKDQNQNRVVCG
jgi:hypothetical protein